MSRQLLLMTALIMTIFGCQSTKKSEGKVSGDQPKVGVLLVNHGSVSKNWRQMLLDIEKEVEGDIMADGRVSEVRTAFMEYTEPSIASQLKAFDQEGYDEVVIVPIFLTISSHTNSDIPNICGLANNPEVQKELAKEKIEIYRARARVTIAPLLDYPSVLKKNIARRVAALSDGSGNEGVALIAYGDADFNQQWEEMVEDIGKYLKVQTGIGSISYGWCGHLVRYSSEPTKKAIEQVLELEEKAIVIPILVANDEYFQGEIIQNGVDAIADSETKVAYKQDAILPDANINKWVVDITQKTVDGILNPVQ
ncbi:sirohydrochlorin chelatase [Persicobacter diffluens]|uniref:Cobalamin biosynthesis protein CbiX n=1 Tax=Persicobacter diffluens TaxID=981 RepID=A0AAN4W1D1_9BACT|nr:hypothetical protein PEDI_38440 [Persicobacter diffluens]